MWSEEDTPLFYALLQKEEFRERVVQLYQKEFLPLLAELCQEKLDGYETQISQAAGMNKIRWPELTQEINTFSIRSYLKGRMEFLRQYWIEEEPFYVIQASTPGTIWCSWAVKPGDNLEQCLLDEEYVWYDKQTNEQIDLSAPVYESRMIYGKHISEIETE